MPLPANQGQQRPQVYPVSLNQGQNQNQSPLIVPLPSSQGQQAPQVYPVSLNQGLYHLLSYIYLLRLLN